VKLLQSAAFLRVYRWLPHTFINDLARLIARARRPRWLIHAAIRAWARRDAIDLSECERTDCRQFPSLEDFFLRHLRPEARPFDPRGIASPVDGRLLAAGDLDPGTRMPVKGSDLTLERIVNGARRRGADRVGSPLSLDRYAGGRYAVLFLSPRGYHRIHMPVGGEIVDVRWLAGRFFPQNERALARIAGVYEKNERAVLRVRASDVPASGDLLLVLVGASVVGGIEIEAAPRSAWVGPWPTMLGRGHARGEEIAHFTFGSTVIAVAPAGMAGPLAPGIGAEVRAGERLWNDPSRQPS
jgi:phosphatidylserine decarboxylase